AGLGKELCHLSGASNVFLAVSRRETQIGAQAVAQIVPIQHTGVLAQAEQLPFQLDRNRGLARTAQPGQPHDATGMPIPLRPLRAGVIFDEDGTWKPAKAPAELFAQVAPNLKEPEEEDEARRALGLIDRSEAECPMNPPSVSTVFRLYCIEELTKRSLNAKT